MKINRIALSAMIASACISGSAFGQTSRTAAPRYAPASYYSYYDEASPNAASKTASKDVVQASATCDNGKACDNSAACDAGNAGGAGGCDSASSLGGALGGRLGSGLGQGCDAGGCDSLSGSSGLFGLGMLGTGRALTDPWKLVKERRIPLPCESLQLQHLPKTRPTRPAMVLCRESRRR